MSLLGMRKTKLLYVENDGALRGLLSNMLTKSEQIEVVGTFENASDALNADVAKASDVALIDYALDHDGLNGIELGIYLRNLNEHIGIIIYSQFSIEPMVKRVPQSMISGWSFFRKDATTSVEDYVAVIQATAAGRGNWRSVVALASEELESEASLFFRLSPRQRSIMALTAKSKSAQEIASQLGLSYAYVRKELSRAYAVLLPAANETEDLKTAAVLRYLDMMRVSQ